MKKIFGFLMFLSLVFVFTPVHAAKRTYAGTTFGATIFSGVKNVAAIDLHKKFTNSSSDTIVAGDMNLYGPFPLSATPTTSAYTSFAIFGDAVTGTTPVAAIDYQVLPSTDLSDTTSWVAACTLGTSKIYKRFAIDSLIGKSIVFRVNNYDGTATQIPGKLAILPKETFTNYIKRD
jgi:hypothetical protein